MDSLKIYSQSDVLALTDQRDGEEKLGQHIQVYHDGEKRNDETISIEGLQQSTAQYVLLGIPEDIGIRANLGIAGAKTTWPSVIKAFLNIQSNPFLKGNEVMVLGYLAIEEPTDTRLKVLRAKTSEMDALVYPIIEKIVNAGKIPIIIGGGHNNAAPIIAGVSKALYKPINVVNIDAHADLRTTTEGRHSGNGFSTAISSGYINEYRIFGLQQNYLNQILVPQLAKSKSIKAFYFEDLLLSAKSTEENWKEFVADLPEPCGLEIDLDSIENVLSSAITSSGFRLNDIRKILLANKKNYRYLHICEGAIELADGRKDLTIGKTIAYLVSDFIKALRPHI